MTPIYKVLKNKDVSINPIWIMRQAVISSEFRIRKLNPDFIKLCFEKLAAEITLQPLKGLN